MRWLDQVLLATKESESPRPYFYWSALTAVAAVVKNNVYLDKFYYKLYPNIYVLLVGKSGLRKGIPIALARSLVNEVNNTRVITGRTSIQKVVTDLSTAKTKPDGGPPITDAVGFLVSSEFASFIIQDTSALTILTDLYDGHYNPEWVNATKKSGNEKLKNVCITMIGASNEVHFKEAVPDNAVGGGFIARTFIVLADKKSHVNPLTVRPESMMPIPELSKHLKKIADRKGPFEWTAEGRELYNDWYQKFSENDHNDSTGTLERIHDHILKVAMLISLASRDDLMLTAADIQESIDSCVKLAVDTRKVTLGGGRAQLAPQTGLILRELLKRPDHAMTRKSILQKFWGQFDSFDLDKIIETMHQAKMIDINHQRGTGDVIYSLQKKVVEKYEQLKKEEE